MKSYYASIIFAGIVLWIISFILLIKNIYPYLFFTAYPSPFLILTGIEGWVLHYKENNKRYPNPFRSIRKSIKQFSGIFAFHLGMMHFLITHFLHWMTFWFLCWIGMMFTMESIVKNSLTFDIARQYVEEDKTVLASIGKIKYYGLFPAGSMKSNGDGEISFTIIGELKTINAIAIIKGQKVIELRYE